jgi:hypothetical protein
MEWGKMNNLVSPNKAVKPPTNKLAIVSLVSGIVLLVFALLGQGLLGTLSFAVILIWITIFTIATGHVARLLIKQSRGVQRGEALAATALALGYAMAIIILCYGLAATIPYFS